MDPSQQKEQFSKTYVRAVATVAGFVISEPEVDDDSVDIGIAASGARKTRRKPKVDLQLKCTDMNVVSATSINYPLKLKNYEDLRPVELLVPRILVVVVVPDQLADWMAHSEFELALRKCGYWVSLRGLPATTNTTSVTIEIPRSNLFDPTQLSGIMARIDSGGLP